LKKRLISLFLTVFMIFSLCSCAVVPEKHEIKTDVEDYLPSEDDLPKDPVVESTVGITLFSWQVPTAEYAQKYCDEIKECGFDNVELVILWSDIEPKKGEFRFIETDSVLDVFTENGLKFSISLLLWSERLDWKDELDYQMTSDGEVFRYDDTRGSFLALNSTENLETVSNTLAYFSAHFADRYKNNILSWSVRTDCFAKLEYSSVVDLDYSPSAIEAFKDYLLGRYISIDIFNNYYRTDYISFDSLFKENITEIVSFCEYDWKCFKQQTLIDFANIYTEIFRIADSSIPVSLQISSFWDTSAAFYRGFFDPYVVSRETTADIIQITDSPSWPHDFSVDLLSSLTDKKISMETDGSWQGEDTFKDYLKQVELSASSGVYIIQTVNWELEDLEAYGESYLSKFKGLYTDAAERSDYDETDVILVNTLDFLLKEPPQDMNDLYYHAYKNMTGKSGVKVRFVTDTQIINDPTILDGIKKIHLGQLDTIIHMRDELGKLLAESNITIVDDNNAQPNFINQYSQPLDEDVQVALRQKIKNS